MHKRPLIKFEEKVEDVTDEVEIEEKKEILNKNKFPPLSPSNPNLSIDLNKISGGGNDIYDNDDNSVLVLLLQCETRACDKNIENLKWVFSDPYFIVQVCKVPPQIIKNIAHEENYNMQKMLNYASEGPYLPNEEGIFIPQKWWNKLPVIIIKDSSVSHLTPQGNTNNNTIIGGMKKKIKTALEKAKNADLFFLCKWNDACDKHIDVVENDNTLKWSTKPTATQAILYIPSARDYICSELLNTEVTLSELLNSHIEKEKLSATVFQPNLIDYDINLAVSNDDYAKANVCEPIQQQTNTTITAVQLVWLISLIILILVVALIMMRTRRY